MTNSKMCMHCKGVSRHDNRQCSVPVADDAVTQVGVPFFSSWCGVLIVEESTIQGAENHNFGLSCRTQALLTNGIINSRLHNTYRQKGC